MVVARSLSARCCGSWNPQVGTGVGVCSAPGPTAAAGRGDLVMSSVVEQDMTAEAGLALIVSPADPSLGSQHLDVRFACEAIEDQSATQLNTLAAPFRSVACRPGSINGE